jgi:hypothetical protein
MPLDFQVMLARESEGLKVLCQILWQFANKFLLFETPKVGNRPPGECHLAGTPV